ncbi:hypothetical protein CDL15_Pgr021126 [Punica granatum]|uniref:glycerophosphodiester phosphodiesterase n=1 Tax=Punica granatum TaxID=22663 RepID=A0A218WKC5_PUNGR|nr:hypothetical protein CDL15_Pgr021126 [Punica granatum]
MITYLFLISLIVQSTLAQNAHANANPAPPAVEWPTLSGAQPVVVARGGFSGIFPDSSEFAVDMAMTTSMGEIIMYCDLQLTKDGMGICQPEVTLDDTTNIAMVFPSNKKTYIVNGKPVQGWFAVDYTFDQLYNNVTLAQNILSRPSLFDGMMPIQAVDDILGRKSVKVLWMNVQHDMFYNQQKHSPVSYIQKVLRFYPLGYISSPEIGFLKAMQGKVNKVRTKLILRLLGTNDVEPTTNQTYGSILKDLQAVKAYATGILVPKDYIWPVTVDKYLGAPTTLVADAHKLGLEVYASGFANDFPACYNYSYDPTSEYLQFIDSQFAVDGFLTDFPPTAAQSIMCFAHSNSNATKPSTAKVLVISHNGASGVYPGSTDLAYQQAVNDGADMIDCTVQMSSDGIAFCLGSADISPYTTAMPTFMSKSTTIPEIQPASGVFSFDLSWTEIQTLKPQIESPFGGDTGYPRDPQNKNKGKFVTLNDFLELAKTKANAAYLASKKGLDIVGSVSQALTNATFDKQATQQVFIESDDTSVLTQFKNVTTYRRLLTIKEKISDAPPASVDEVKKYADGVVVTRSSLIPTSNSFLMGNTSVIKEMHAANLSVYVSVLRNEYLSLAFDYYADPTFELATYIVGLEVDGVITDFPATATRYTKSRCFDINGDQAILPVQPGSLVSLVEGAGPPAEAPAPALEAKNVVDPPLPPVVAKTSTPSPATSPSSTKSGSSAISAHLGYSLMALGLLRLLFSMGH